MQRYCKIAFTVALLAAIKTASAHVPVDSFNSVNAALNPSIALNRDHGETPASNGPTDALIRLVQQRRKSHPPIVENAAQAAEQ